MSKQLFATFLALVLCSTAVADLYVNIATSGGDWPHSPYIITPTSDIPAWMPASFETFCVERGVTFTPGNYRATIDDRILYANRIDGLDLNDDAKKIYAAYLNNELTGIAANTIQTSVWGALSYDSYTIDGAVSDVIDLDTATSGWTNVKVLNLWGDNDLDVQSQMVMTPVPGAELLGVLGIGLASYRLRRRKHAAKS